MKQRLVCIKVGGSLITDKAQPFVANAGAIELFAKELAAAWQEQATTSDFLVGNGVGSFGHFTAHQYGLRDGAKTSEQRYGMCLTHNQVRAFSNQVAKALTDERLPVFALSPGDQLSLDNKEVTGSNIAVVTGLLAQDCIPLIHGDGLLDTTRGVTIYSTEKSLFWYARQLRENYDDVIIIELLSAGGVLDADGKILSELLPADQVTVLSAHDHDVTGGIVGKVASAREAAGWATRVQLIGLTAGSLQAALRGEPVGTLIKNG